MSSPEETDLTYEGIETRNKFITISNRGLFEETDLTYEGIETRLLSALNFRAFPGLEETDLTYEGIETIISAEPLPWRSIDEETDLTYEGIETCFVFFHFYLLFYF